MNKRNAAEDCANPISSVDALFQNRDNDCSLIGFVRLPFLIKLLGVSKTTIYKEIREGRFPKQVRISPRASAWRITDIKAHLEQLTHARSK